VGGLLNPLSLAGRVGMQSIYANRSSGGLNLGVLPRCHRSPHMGGDRRQQHQDRAFLERQVLSGYPKRRLRRPTARAMSQTAAIELAL